MNNLKKVKLPKKLYRGIRAQDLYSHDTFKEASNAIWKADKSYSMKRHDAIALLIKWICNKKLPEIIDGKILSFTSSENIAKYFSNGEGIILAVDPSKVEILTSELVEPLLSQPDFVSNKKEKEYIIRIPNDYDFKPQDIIINDMDYFIAEQNPLSVALFDHDNKEAIYNMYGYDINAFFYWSSNNKGHLVFNITKNDEIVGGYWLTRNQVKSQLGFDPLPTPKNLNEISNFKVINRKNY